METSIFLGKVIGPFTILLALSLLVNKRKIPEMINDLERNFASLYLSGILALLLGLLVVVSHNVWTSDWRVIITIFGWAAILKGLVRLFIPEKVPVLARKFTASNGILNFWIIVMLVVGAWLAYHGFILNY